MKNALIALMVLVGSSAFADTTLLKCSVVDSSSVSLNVTLADDATVDFVIVDLKEGAKLTQFFSQMDKGEIAAQMKEGFLNLLALTEKSSMDDGVIKNTGFLGLGLEQDGSFGGFLAAQGNIYPLTCTK